MVKPNRSWTGLPGKVPLTVVLTVTTSPPMLRLRGRVEKTYLGLACCVPGSNGLASATLAPLVDNDGVIGKAGRELVTAGGFVLEIAPYGCGQWGLVACLGG